MVVSPQRLTRWPSYVRDRHAAITYTTPRDAPHALTRWPLYVHHRHDDEPSNRATPLCGTQLAVFASR
ncbi:hypothetical protein CKJ66_15895 [Mycobacterium avium]|uniref:Uncharacterized protein n=1 Tax=Mycobacterium avium TaxID=1764 RepID=A0A2A2ZH04_MYCAV|nr:hypothetical protein CKJ74_14045 [Mycobacterium avium]PBA05725.1 hypothetical protein CKJ73_13890 [Mycobacterium avium]PBA10772.1 hypothetical protein CKJ70_14195 [Mycobacterium avium]PBA25635.1 hypothetical protein CKJ66_15895 [Mycobacterium avium]PBA35711.1 hypothetical protein CKJ64_14370 [Mycobacterium avium]